MKRNLLKLSAVFAQEIKTYAKAHKCTLVEASIIVAEKLGIAEDQIQEHLNKEMIDSITIESSQLKLIKPEHRRVDKLSVFFDGTN